MKARTSLVAVGLVTTLIGCASQPHHPVYGQAMAACLAKNQFNEWADTPRAMVIQRHCKGVAGEFEERAVAIASIDGDMKIVARND